MDEFDFYQGTHTGGEIDQAVDIVADRVSTIEDPSYFSQHSGDDLTNQLAVFKAINDRIIEVTISSITGTGTVSGSFTQVHMQGIAAKITSQHKVIAASFSNPSAVTGDWTITTSDNDSIAYSGGLNGTTNLTVILGIIGQDVTRINI